MNFGNPQRLAGGEELSYDDGRGICKRSKPTSLTCGNASVWTASRRSSAAASNEGKNTIIEIGRLLAMKPACLRLICIGCTYAMLNRRLKVNLLEYQDTPLGGLKGSSFTLLGDGAWSMMRFESGVHRVQRIPTTEAQGRIHTSTVTVAVLAEAEEVDVQLNPEDLRIDVFRSSGHGGQSVNTTDSAVRVTHLPTGLSVASQQEKSQHRNKEIAMTLLRARLLEIKQSAEDEKNSSERRSQVGL